MARRKTIPQSSHPDGPLHCEASPVEWVQAAEGTEPQAKRFSMTAYTGSQMRVNRWADPVVIDLAGLKASGEQIPILLNHDPAQIVGHADAIEITAQRVKLDGAASGANEFAMQVVASAKQGFPWKASVGAMPEKVEYVDAGAKATANGRTFTGPVQIVRAASLVEVSFVPIAADGKTSVKVAAASETEMEKEIEQQTPPVQAAADPTAEIRAAAAAEVKRLGEIAKVAGKHPEIHAKAIEEGWAPAKAELEVLRAERATAPAIHASKPQEAVNDEVIQAAFCKSAGLQSLEKAFKAETLEAADKSYRGFGLQETLLHFAGRAGYSGRAKITAGNCAEVLKAAFSTHTLTTLLTTTGNKLLLEGFMSIPQSWRRVAAVRSVNDFKQVTAFRMNASLEYEELGPAGEIKHGTVSQESYTMQAKTYAKMLALTRTDIINDDLGAFNDLRNRLGLGAAIKMNKVFWTLWLSTANGAAFWTAARGNLVTSAALATAGLDKAVKAFRDLVGPDGNMVSLEPKLVLVPTALEATAQVIYKSMEMRDTTASTKYPTANIYQGSFEPVPVPELGNSSYTGYSATNWWLLADPMIMASAIMCFLDGQQAPTIEQAEADFNTLGIQMRGYHDFGAAMTEYQASVEAQA